MQSGGEVWELGCPARHACTEAVSVAKMDDSAVRSGACPYQLRTVPSRVTSAIQQPNEHGTMSVYALRFDLQPYAADPLDNADAPTSGKDYGNIDFAPDRFVSSVNRPVIDIPLSIPPPDERG